MSQRKYIARAMAVTMLELLIVVLIIGLLATIATGIYTGEADRARIAATKALINNLEIGITRYEVDTGSLPPSGSGDVLPPVSPQATTDTAWRDGSGYLHQALVHSLSGSTNNPNPSTWNGPYISFQNEQLVTAPTASGANDHASEIDIADPWGMPILYVRYSDYNVVTTNFRGGTWLFFGPAPAGANPNLPAPNPSYDLGETYYNAKSYQIISFGKDRQSFGLVNISNFNGTGADDITNFGY